MTLVATRAVDTGSIDVVETSRATQSRRKHRVTLVVGVRQAFIVDKRQHANKKGDTQPTQVLKTMMMMT